MQITAAIVANAGGTFQVGPAQLEDPRADEILVRMVGVGICHTDEAARQGNFRYRFPAVFGHEGAGIVEKVGRDVHKVVPGDSVVLTFRSCGQCDSCTQRHPSYCRQFPLLNFIGARPDGSQCLHAHGAQVSGSFFGQSSFASYALAYESNVVKLQSREDLEIMGPLGCGVQTGAGAVLHSLNCRPGASLLIAGGGSVGLSAVMAGRLRQCAPIILLEPNASRRALALELGATHVIDPAAGDVVKAVRAIVAGGADYAFDTSGLPAVLGSALACLAPLGTLGLVGIPPAGADALGLATSMIITGGLSVRGIMEGDSDPDQFIPELVAQFRAGRFPFDRLIRRYPFARINDALAAQHSGECLKAVLLFDA